jgi:glycosyltransferase involved in cell wall biosynthesis
MAKMLTGLGHEVFFYGAEGSDVEEYCNSDKLHFVQTHTLADIRADYGTGYNLPDADGLGYPWRTMDFKHDFHKDPKMNSTIKFYANASNAINSTKKPDDFLLCTEGIYHKPIADSVKLFLTVEPGIGYRGSVPSMYRGFESPYIQNFTYGSEHPLQSMNGNYYDRVIPNYFDPNDIEYSDKKEPYYLFIGRLIRRKGILTAYHAAKAVGAKLIIAGQGGYITAEGHLIDNHPQEFDIPNDSDWEYVGYADVEKRKKLMAHATAVFTPTEYLECFAGTHVEAMLSGTPPITTDFGVFPYTIPDNLNGVVGFRCNTLQDFVDAAKKASFMKEREHRYIADYGGRFLMDKVRWDFQKWFEDLYNLYESAVDENKGLPWEQRRKGWSRVV